MSEIVISAVRDPLVLGEKTYHQITEDVCRPVEGKANKWWWASFSIAFVCMCWGISCLAYNMDQFLSIIRCSFLILLLVFLRVVLTLHLNKREYRGIFELMLSYILP